MSQGVSAPGLIRTAIVLGRSIAAHFDVVAASWLIVLAFAWAVYFASMSASRPSDWTGPLIGGGSDWNAAVVSSLDGSAPPVHPPSHR